MYERNIIKFPMNNHYICTFLYEESYKNNYYYDDILNYGYLTSKKIIKIS